MTSPETLKIAQEQGLKHPSLEVTNTRENPEKAMGSLDFYGKIEQYALERGVRQKEGWGDALTSATGEAKELIAAGKESGGEENYTNADTVIEEAKKIAAEILKAIDAKANGEIETPEDASDEEPELDEELENAKQNLNALLELIKEIQKDIPKEDGDTLEDLNNEIAELEKKAVEALMENNVQQANTLIAEIDDRAQEMESKKDAIKNKTPEKQSTEEALMEAIATTEKAAKKTLGEVSVDTEQTEFHPSVDSLQGPHFTLEATLADLSQHTTEKIKTLERKLDVLSTEKTKKLKVKIESVENKLLQRIIDIEAQADNEDRDDMTDEELDSLLPFVQEINQLAEDIQYYENSDGPLPDTEHTQEKIPEIKSIEEDDEEDEGEDTEPQQDKTMKKRGGKFDDEENSPKPEGGVKKTKSEGKITEQTPDTKDTADDIAKISTPEETITSSGQEQLRDEIRAKAEALSEDVRNHILPEEGLEKAMESADVARLKNILNSIEKMPGSLAEAKERRENKRVEEGAPVAPQTTEVVPSRQGEAETEAPSPAGEEEEKNTSEETSALHESTPAIAQTSEISSEETVKENLRVKILALKEELPEESIEYKQLSSNFEKNLETMQLKGLDDVLTTLTSLKSAALKKEADAVQETPEKPNVDEVVADEDTTKETIEPTGPSPFDILDLENPKEARENLARILKEIQGDVRRASKNHQEKQGLESASEKLRKKIVDFRTSTYELESMDKEDIRRKQVPEAEYELTYKPKEDIRRKRRSKAEKTAAQRIEKVKELYHELIEIMGSVPDEEPPETTEQTPDTKNTAEVSPSAEEAITDSKQEELRDKIRTKVQALSENARKKIIPEDTLESALKSDDVAYLENILNSIEKMDSFDKEKESKKDKGVKEEATVAPQQVEEREIIDEAPAPVAEEEVETVQETPEQPIGVDEKKAHEDVSTKKEGVATSQQNKGQPLDKQGEAMSHLIEKLEQQESGSSKNEVTPKHQLEQEEDLRENRENIGEKIGDARSFNELRAIIEQHPDIHKGFLDFEGPSNSDAVYGKDGYDYIIPKIQSGELSISRLPHDGWGIKKKIAELFQGPKEEAAVEKEQPKKMSPKERMDTIVTIAGEITEDLEKTSVRKTGRINGVQDVITGSKIIRRIKKSIEGGEPLTEKEFGVMNGWFESAVGRLKKLTQPENENEKTLNKPQNEYLTARESVDKLLEEVKVEMEKVINTLFVPKFTRKGIFGKKVEEKVNWSESDEWQRLRGQNMQELNKESAEVLSKAYGIEERQINAAKKGLYELYEKSKIEPYAEHTIETYIDRVLKKSKIDAR